MKEAKAQHVGVTLNNTCLVRRQLMDDIVRLERQAEVLALNGGPHDFSMIQTYKEMIHSRREALARLPVNS